MSATAAAGVAAQAAAGAGSSSTAGAIGGAAVSGGLSIFSSLMNNLFNQQNIDKQNYLNYQLQQQAYARDDTAYQRLARDLESAGLSKWLATGKSAMSSDPVSMDTASYDFGGFSDAAKHSLEAYNNLVATQIAKESHAHEMTLYEAQARKANAEAQYAEAEARRATHDANVWDSRDDTASNDSMGLRLLAEAIKSLKGERQTFNFNFTSGDKSERQQLEADILDGRQISDDELYSRLSRAIGFEESFLREIFSPEDLREIVNDIRK